MSAPGYWMYETSGILRPAIEAYLDGGPMTGEHIAALRAYLRQWIDSDCWQGPMLTALRGNINYLTTREAIEQWLEVATEAGIDPL